MLFARMLNDREQMGRGTVYMLESCFDFNRLMISTNLWFMCFSQIGGMTKVCTNNPLTTPPTPV